MPDQPIKHGRNLTVDSLRALDNGSKAAATRAQTALERVIEWRQDLSDVLDMFSRDSLKTNASSNVSDPMTGLVRKLNDVISTSDDEFKRLLKLQLQQDEPMLRRISLLSAELSQVNLSPVPSPASAQFLTVPSREALTHNEAVISPSAASSNAGVSFLELSSPAPSSSTFLTSEHPTTLDEPAIRIQNGGHDVPKKAAQVLGLPGWIAPKIVKRGDLPPLNRDENDTSRNHPRNRTCPARLDLPTAVFDDRQKYSAAAATTRRETEEANKSVSSLFNSLVESIEHRLFRPARESSRPQVLRPSVPTTPTVSVQKTALLPKVDPQVVRAWMRQESPCSTASASPGSRTKPAWSRGPVWQAPTEWHVLPPLPGAFKRGATVMRA